MPALRRPAAPQASRDGLGDGRALRRVLADGQRGELVQALQSGGAAEVSEHFLEIVSLKERKQLLSTMGLLR